MKELIEVIKYDETSPTLLTWQRDVGKMKAGSPAGTLGNTHYPKIKYKGKGYYIHNVVFFLHNQDVPFPVKGLVVDHIDRNKRNNHYSNLRLATVRENAQNKLTGRIKLKGAFFKKHLNKWCSQIVVDGKTKHLGYFDTDKEAHEAYVSASKEFHGRFGKW